MFKKKKINWNKYFDHVFIITRCQSFLRQQKMDKKLKELGLTDYQYWWVPDYDLKNSQIFKDNGLKIGHQRCTIGHYTLWKMCYERQLRNVLILEDDLCFLKDTNTIKEMLELFYSKRDMLDIYLFDWQLWNQTEHLNMYWLCSCYVLVSEKGINQMIKYQEKYNLVCDNLLIDNITKNKDYILHYTTMGNERVSKDIYVSKDDTLTELKVSPIRLGIQVDKNYNQVLDNNFTEEDKKTLYNII